MRPSDLAVCAPPRAVGEPIDCPRIESPTAEQIDEYHRRYMEALEALYDKYKDVYAKDRRHEMRFVH